ncbi:TonB-dependent receptor [Sesbania bispinosa]|nr:TonB-dependent receptor [Sesbania bispinosa]
MKTPRTVLEFGYNPVRAPAPPSGPTGVGFAVPRTQEVAACLLNGASVLDAKHPKLDERVALLADLANENVVNMIAEGGAIPVAAEFGVLRKNHAAARNGRVDLKTTLECLQKVLVQTPPIGEGGGRKRDRGSERILKTKKSILIGVLPEDTNLAAKFLQLHGTTF